MAKTPKTEVRDCPACEQKNRVPKKYKGIAVCGSCRTPMFPTLLLPRRKRWTRRDWHLAVPILMLAYPTYWALNHDWTPVWESALDWVASISVNVTIISAIALAWLIVGLSIKVAWEEWWLTKQQRHHPPPVDEPALIDLGAWEVLREYFNIARAKADDLRFALRKDTP